MFGMAIPMIGNYGAKTPHWGTLACFSGAQSMIGVLNLMYVAAGICLVTTLHSLCNDCLTTFESGNETCTILFRNHSDIVLSKTWCESSPVNYIVPLLFMSSIIYVSFKSAISARKMGQTKTIQIITIDEVVATI